MVTNVLNSSPAAVSGLLLGDIIISVDDELVRNSKDLNSIIGYEQNRTLRLKIRRNSNQIELTVKI